MERSSEDIAYLAGFLDGEGCVTIAKDNKGKYFRLRLTASNVVASPIVALLETFGGKMYYSEQTDKTKQPIYAWRICGNSAANCINTLLPYSLVKRSQYLLAIEFQTSRSFLTFEQKEEAYLNMKNLKKVAPLGL